MRFTIPSQKEGETLRASDDAKAFLMGGRYRRWTQEYDLIKEGDDRLNPSTNESGEILPKVHISVKLETQEPGDPLESESSLCVYL